MGLLLGIALEHGTVLPAVRWSEVKYWHWNTWYCPKHVLLYLTGIYYHVVCTSHHQSTVIHNTEQIVD